MPSKRTLHPGDTLFVLGIDPGSDLGAVLLRVSYGLSTDLSLFGPSGALAAEREDILWRTTLQRKSLTMAPFLAQLTAVLDRHGGAVPTDRVDIVACEQAHLRRFRTKTGSVPSVVPFAALNQIIGAVMAAAARWRADFRLVPPATWRQTLTGAGNPTPRRVELAVASQFPGIPKLTEHEVSALGVALHVARVEVTGRKIEARSRRPSPRKPASRLAR